MNQEFKMPDVPEIVEADVIPQPTSFEPKGLKLMDLATDMTTGTHIARNFKQEDENLILEYDGYYREAVMIAAKGGAMSPKQILAFSDDYKSLIRSGLLSETLKYIEDATQTQA